MASGSQSMTTYYAKRIVGDASAAQADSALLQTGAGVIVDTWILNRTNRATTYGIKYVYDDTDGHDKVEFYGGAAAASAWVQLDTGDITAHKFIGALEGNADSATALTSNAGGKEQPIYFTGGKPAATSYALKATVNNGDANYVAYYSDARTISSAKASTAMIMPAHYYHNLYNNNPTTGTTVYVHYYNGDTTSTNTFANLRVKSGSSYKVLAFGGDGELTWNGTMTANGGYLKSTLNSNTVQIGSQNASYCHITNSANIPFWFNKSILMEQNTTIGNAGTQYRPFQLYLGRYTTTASNDLDANNPLIEFSNSDRSQYCQLMYDDHDSLCTPDSLTLVGNQNGITFICKNGPIWVQGGSNAGGNINRLTTSSGMPGNMQYNTSRRGTQIYSNGIAFADPYNGNSNNDAGWIRHQETTANTGELEIAVGDDGDETIVVRQYNTSNGVKRTLTLLSKDGYTFIPSYLNIGGHEKNASSPTYVWGSNSSDNYLRSYQTSHLSVATAVNASNTQSGYGAKKITVGGNANTYYPVLITNHTSHFAWTLLNITRGYSEPAPDTWNTNTHRGGLTLTILSNGDTSWGGNHHIGTSKLNCIIDLSEEYTTMVGGVYVTVNGLLVLLRGGNADYWITSNNGQDVSASITLGTFTASDKKTYAARTSPDTANLSEMRWNNLWTVANATTSSSCTGNAATATRINGNLAAATSDANRNIWVSSTASADGIPNYISGFNMNPSTKVFTVPAGTRISPSAGDLYLGNSGNQKWVYIQDMCGQDGQKWKIHQNGNAEFTGTVTATKFSGPLTGDVTGNCSGSSGSCTGNAATATALKDRTNSTASYLNYGAAGLAASAITWLCCWNGYEVRAISKAEMANAVDGSHKWVRLGGDTMTGLLKITTNSNTLTIGAQNSSWCHFSSGVKFHFSQAIWAVDGFHVTNSSGSDLGANHTKTECTVNNTNGKIGIHSSTNRGLYEFTDSKWIIYLQNSDDTVRSGYKIYGAVWNDFAEMREGDITEGGYAVYDDGHGHMKLCTERLQPGARLTSDTFGIVVGHTETAKTPIGVAGRVLVYPAQDRINYKVGDAVCAAPGGKVDLMTREEIMMYPERILGIVSEIPDYEVWNQRYKAEEEKEYTETNIQVNGRIWIYVR